MVNRTPPGTARTFVDLNSTRSWQSRSRSDAWLCRTQADTICLAGLKYCLADGTKRPGVIEEEFEQNGCSEPFRHPDFVEFLRYFIEGPVLPEEAAEGLLKILDSICTSGTMVTRTQKHVRDMVRRYDLDRHCSHHAGTQFFRLAVEIGMSATEAQGLRKAARSVK